MAYCDTGRSLKTARAVLKVLRLMAERHDGISVDDVATHLGKSRSTAAYLLNSLVEEGFAIRDVIVGHGRYRLGPSRPEWVGAAAPPRPGVARELPPSVLAGRLQEALKELYRRTGQRSYLAGLDGGAIVVLDAKGRQGLAKIPGLGTTIRSETHSLAIGKVFLAGLEPAAVTRVLTEHQLTAYTPSTITAPEALEAELDRVRTNGFAVDREEFASGFSCVAAPVVGPSGRILASLGVSVPAARLAADGASLARAVVELARWASDDEAPAARGARARSGEREAARRGEEGAARRRFDTNPVPMSAREVIPTGKPGGSR